MQEKTREDTDSLRKKEDNGDRHTLAVPDIFQDGRMAGFGV